MTSQAPATDAARSPAASSSAAGALPNMVIIGAQKSGTTALHYYLRRHPAVTMSKPKELDFFIAEKNWKRGVDWYRRHFDTAGTIRGESSPNYTAAPYFDDVPARMASVVPDARLIYVVRDPVKRIRAQWIHHYANRVEHKPMREAVFVPGTTYIPRSSYAMQLERFLQHFPMAQILVIDQDELLGNRRETLAKAFRFLHVDDTFWHQRFETLTYETRNRRRRTLLGVAASRLPMPVWKRLRHRRPFALPFEHPAMEEEVAQRLGEALADDVARFRELTGQKFEGWSV
jgi:hypothetical protein